MRTARKVLFLHIPKTAGDTMQAIIGRYFPPEAICDAYTWTILLGLEHRSLEKFTFFHGHFFGPVDRFIQSPHFSFTLLRNPVERALSHYGHVMRDPNHYLHRRAVELGTFDAYLSDPQTRMTVANYQSRMLALNVDVASLYENLNEEERAAWCLERELETMDAALPDDQLLSAAKRRLESLDLIGITERFRETLALLCYERAWKLPAETVMRNANVHRLRQSELAPETLDELHLQNQVDLQLYQWAVDVFDSRFMQVIADLVSANARRGWWRRLAGQQYG